MFNFYPPRDTMIAILRKEMPFKINFDSGDAETVEHIWDLWQSIVKKTPDKEKRDIKLIEYLKEVLTEDELKKYEDSVKGGV